MANSSKITLIKNAVSKELDIPALRELHIQIGFPLEKAEFLQEENPIIKFETYALLLQIFDACHIIDYIETAVNTIFPNSITTECHNILCQFIHMTFYGHCRYLLSKEQFYNTEEDINADIIEYVKDVFKCLDNDYNCVGDIITIVKTKNEEEKDPSESVILNETD